MKYKAIFDRVIQQEIDKINSGKGKNDNSSKRCEWKAIVVALKMPEAANEQLYDEFNALMDTPLDYKKFSEVLWAVNLDTIKKRRYIAKNTKRTVVSFKALLDGDKEAAKIISHYVYNVFERDIVDKRLYFKEKYLLTYLIVFDEDLKSKEGELILENYLEGFCGKVLRRIYKNLSKEMGLKKSTKEVIESAQKALEETEEEGSEDENIDKDKLIERLKFQISNYKNALGLVESMFEELKDSVEESAQEARNTAVGEFFASLNAGEYGNILDSLITVEDRLAKLRADKIRIQPEVMPLTIIFKQLLRFIKEYGIEPTDIPGREFKASYEEIALLNYIGEPYEDDKEIKKLRVTAPGWRYKDYVISLPTVQEL